MQSRRPQEQRVQEDDQSAELKWVRMLWRYHALLEIDTDLGIGTFQSKRKAYLRISEAEADSAFCTRSISQVRNATTFFELAISSGVTR